MICCLLQLDCIGIAGDLAGPVLAGPMFSAIIVHNIAISLSKHLELPDLAG